MTTPAWRRSSRCDSGSCVEVARCGDDILIRSSDRPDGPVLQVTVEEFRSFVGGLVNGEFGQMTRTN